MKKLFFTRYDFENKEPIASISFTEFFASIAQAKFDEWFKNEIENATPVRINKLADGTINNITTVIEYAEGNTRFWNYKARLIDIQEIKTKCEKHKPVCTFVSATEKSENGLVPTKFICDLCGVDLVPDWREKT